MASHLIQVIKYFVDKHIVCAVCAPGPCQLQHCEIERQVDLFTLATRLFAVRERRRGASWGGEGRRIRPSWCQQNRRRTANAAFPPPERARAGYQRIVL
jgi:hypothetical protein